jgi:pimeloyl-ACP methyl ester carboxylesterase
MEKFNMTLPEGKFIELATRGGVVKTHYHEWGARHNYVIFLQTGGAGTSAYMCWYLNAEEFAKSGYHVFAPDAIGFGFTEILTEAATGQVSGTEFLVAFMDALGIDTAHVVGNSMGSMTSVRLAIDHPSRVKSLILTGGEPRVETEDSRAIAQTLGKTNRMNFVRDMLSKPEVSLEDMRNATADFYYDRNHNTIDEVAKMRLSIISRPGVREKERDAAFRQIKRGRSNFQASEMANIQAPAYLIHGRDERFFFSKEVAPILLDCAVKACNVIPNCSVTVLSFCGHWPQIEMSGTFNTLSLEFLERIRQ